MLDVSRRLVVIIGGGEVALRKARGLLAAGAENVRAVALQFHGDFPGGVERVLQAYRPEHLEGAGLVLAATDSPAVNAAVVGDARARGVLVSRADADEEAPGDFITPARLDRGPITVTVSAGSPALAAMIRDRLADGFDPAWPALASAMQAIRPRVLANGKMGGLRRREALRTLATPQAMAIVSDSGKEGLWKWIVERFPELA